MKKQKKCKISLKWELFGTVAVSWVLPIVIIVAVAGFLINSNYEKHLHRQMEDGTAHAMKQVELRLKSALEASKAVSYNGVVRDAYQEYQKTQDQVALNNQVTEYLSQGYSRDKNLEAVFITFLDAPDIDYSYVVSKGVRSYDLLQKYRTNARANLLRTASEMDTGIRFQVEDGNLYMVRNLMDKTFTPYGVLVMRCNCKVLFQSLEAIPSLTCAELTIDDTVLTFGNCKTVCTSMDCREVFSDCSTEFSGHSLRFRAAAMEKNLWGAMPGLRWTIALLVLMVVPLLVFVVVQFYRYISRPMEVLVGAANRVQAGERGYTIEEEAKSQEFQKLILHFNAMSTKLQDQFERLYLEQQALQEAKIKALQSQINPHFLGNTLEIINWEARIAQDDKVSAMIEALSTMLDAAIGRDGRAQITLKEELSYVDAYLYIIKQRMGDDVQIRKEIDETLLNRIIPRLVLQPLAENAVEHDISKRHGSELWLRVYRKDETIFLEVEHEGTMTQEDQEKIETLLSLTPEAMRQKGQVGIRNLNQRLHLLYGEKGKLTIREVTPGRILASVEIPDMSELA